jgi:hypothetical protein
MVRQVGDAVEPQRKLKKSFTDRKNGVIVVR